MTDKTRGRVAMTVEQFWHRVPGGTAVAAAGMISGLKAKNSIDIIGVAARHRSAPKEPGWIEGLDVRNLALPRLALYESWHRLRKPPIESATGPIDLIHATTIAVPPRSCPLIVTIHDLAFLDDPANFTKRGLSFFRRGLQLALVDADRVHTPSDATARDCIAAGFDPDRVRVVHLGHLAQPVDDATVRRVRSHHGLDRPYVLWTGTIEPRKNLKGLIEGFALSGVDHSLVIAGPAGWNEDLDRAVSPIADRTRMLGYVPRRELDALYAGADAFCWPSFKEGFGFPILEAMAHGTPVITSRGTSTEELAGDAAILVDPRDAQQIARALVDVLQDEALARKLSDAGKARAAGFTWGSTATGLMDLYGELL